jgi:DNA-binding GntR family transcriptional regulator
MSSSALAEELAGRIAEHIRFQRLAAGTRLPERMLAELFNVSRSPIRRALQVLETRRVVRRERRNGYVIAIDAAKARPSHEPAIGRDEALYLKIADDHLCGRVPAKVSENALMRTYRLRRGEIVRLLRRAAEEGWAERLPGHGWAFLPVLATPEAYAQSYRFRILIEPAGILEPGFALDRPALLRCRDHQQALVDGEGLLLSPAALFAAGSRFHELLIGFSGNPFLIDALQRINNVRRLIEYKKIVDRARWLARCREHIELIDILLQGDRATAADFLRRHLEAGSKAKSGAVLAPPPLAEQSDQRRARRLGGPRRGSD